MTMGLTIKVKTKQTDAPNTVRGGMNRLMILAGAELRNIYIYESKQRPDKLGGRDGAKDIGDLSNSIDIQSQDYNHVLVGTNLKYARALAFGESDPSVKFEDIFDWASRKRILKFKRGSKNFYQENPEMHPFVKNVTKKIRSKGPIPNPFQERTKERFKKDMWPMLSKEAKL